MARKFKWNTDRSDQYDTPLHTTIGNGLSISCENHYGKFTATAPTPFTSKFTGQRIELRGYGRTRDAAANDLLAKYSKMTDPT